MNEAQEIVKTAITCHCLRCLHRVKCRWMAFTNWNDFQKTVPVLYFFKL